MSEPVLNWDQRDKSKTSDLNNHLEGLVEFYQGLIDRPRMLPEQVPPLVMTQDAHEQYMVDLERRYVEK